jgi:HTH-type transcriptional regulator/antitoxin HipB
MSIDVEFIVEEYLIENAEQLPALGKLFRQQTGATQQEMGENLGISQKTYSSLERKLSVANFSRVLELMDLLGYQIIIRKKSNHDQNPASTTGSSGFLD